MATNNQQSDWVCRAKIPPSSSSATQDAVRAHGVADVDRLWQRGQQLRIGFLGGSEQLQRQVLATARQWTRGGPGGANLVFEAAENPETADIRVSFDRRDGYWSVVGTDARTVEPGQSTMNLGDLVENTPERDFSSVVLHEFGHAIGLLHEHNHPNADLHWKKHVVYADLGAPPNGWTPKEVDFNVFAQYDPSRVVMSDNPDLVSIMIYTIPARWLDDQPPVRPSYRLSGRDGLFIQRLYPVQIPA